MILDEDLARQSYARSIKTAIELAIDSGVENVISFPINYFRVIAVVKHARST